MPVLSQFIFGKFIQGDCGNDCSENPASPEASAEAGAELQRKACLPPKISRLLFVENY